MANLELKFLGGFSLRLNGLPLSELKTQKGQALVCYLAVTRKPAPRAALAGLFWPDMPEADAHMNLRKVLVRLKPVSPYLGITREALAFNPAVSYTLDVAEFEAAASVKNDMDCLQTAVDLFQGDFLDGFSVDDAPLFDEWVLAQRARLRALALGALEVLIAHFAGQAAYETAIGYARRVLALEPWHEETHRELMRLLALSGQRSAALIQFETCRGILAGELGVEPAPATVGLYERIKSGALPGLETGQAERKHNLPLQVTRFFGREREVAQLIERLGKNRLVTLTGSGGVGKTRLSLRTAEEVLDDFRDGVWLVELAPLSDAVLVGQQIASSLGLRDESVRPILETLTVFLRDRQVLLVLDNCEHLLEACGRLADTLLRACPRLRILASSREPLGIAGEAVFSVPSLPFPDPDHLPPIERLNEYVAVSLFIDRARLVRPDYQVAAHNAACLARICQRLDGIPLAIEMAAARLNILSAEQLADRLDDAFRLLTSGSRSALPRQQTLRATVDWSYELLSERERLLFQRLSVFAGGCTLAAAEAVCTAAGLSSGDVLGELASLVAKSMVIADREPAEETRYHMLEMVRQYAREKLQDSGESVPLSARHRDYFLAFAETNVPKIRSRERLIWTRALAAERENFRRALEWSFGDLSEVEAGPRLLAALRDSWNSYQEQVDWLKKGVAWCQSHAGISDRVYASLLSVAAGPVAQDDPQTGRNWNLQAVDISRRLGPEGRDILMWTLRGLGIGYLDERRDFERAVAPLAEAEAIFLELGPDRIPPARKLWETAMFAAAKAGLATSQGRYQDAKMEASESIRLFEETGDRWISIVPQIALGIACFNLGEYAQARDTFLAALSLIEESGDREKAFVLLWLGKVDFRQGQLERALDYYRASLHEAVKIPDYNIVASCLGMCAGIAAKAGEPARVARLSGAAKALYAKQGRKPWEDSSLETLMPGWRDGPDVTVISEAYEAGLAMNADQAMAYALGDDES